jgi:bifunctional DNA-binding transcriptional regulator/antitoxin component of YhaV-PrlF toxin-antitoxin module
MMMADTATLSTTFRISIPKALRAPRGWGAGLTFAFIPKGTGVLLMPIPRRETLKGIARGADPRDVRDRSDRT